MRLPNYGVRPIGALVGGFLAGTIGVRPTLLVGAIGALGGVLWLLRSPLPRTIQVPEPDSGSSPDRSSASSAAA